MVKSPILRSANWMFPVREPFPNVSFACRFTVVSSKKIWRFPRLTHRSDDPVSKTTEKSVGRISVVPCTVMTARILRTNFPESDSREVLDAPTKGIRQSEQPEYGAKGRTPSLSDVTRGMLSGVFETSTKRTPAP